MKVWKIVDPHNPRKVWHIKRYGDGHYYAAQEISGKMFKFYSPKTRRYYVRYQRITKDRWSDLLKGAEK